MPDLIYGSVCSGIEAATVAWQPLGWRPCWFSEIDPFCCAVLQHHYPQARNLGCITHVSKDSGPVDLLVGGTPCQAFSVNGAREGFADTRGNITLEYLRALEVLEPRWFVWENVPGVLSVDRGRTFARITSFLAELGFAAAWRVLDLQYFGIPQRRRRLFLVGHSGGDLARVAAVLFDREADTDVSGSVCQVSQEDTAQASRSLGPIGWTGDPTPKIGEGISPTLRSRQGGEGAGYAWKGEMMRFTPREWERLQGLPDDYTLVTFKGKPASDRQRFHVLGNTFPVPILHWIGQRIQVVDAL